MSSERTYAVCEKCGTFVGIIDDGGGTLSCCGSAMKILKANTTDAATEKHVPALKLDGTKLTVSVGEVLHPMTEEHRIKWIACAQNNLTQRKTLEPNEEPKAEFTIDPNEGNITVYEYCNLHGLWKSEL